MATRHVLLVSAALALAALPLTPRIGHADETATTMEALPKAARETLLKEAGKDKIEKIEKTTEKGVTVFEAKVHRAEGGGSYELKVDSAGKLLKKD